MSLIWDAIAVIIIALCIHSGVKKGLVRSVVDVLCYFLALMAGKYAGPLLAQKAYDGFLEERIITTITNSINSAVESGAASGSDVLEMLPGWLEAIIKSFYPDFSSLSLDSLGEFITPEKMQQVAISISQTIQGIVVEFVGWVLILVISILALLVLQKIAKIFGAVNKLPIIGSLNMVLGGVVGVGVGVLMGIFVGALATIIGTIAGGDVDFLSPEHIDNSFIMGTLKSIILK